MNLAENDLILRAQGELCCLYYGSLFLSPRVQKCVNRWVEVSRVSGALDCIQQDVNPLWRYMARSEEGQ